MTAAGPVHDSALNAIGYAARVLTKPSFWLVPLVLSAIVTAPLLALPMPSGVAGLPGTPGSPPGPSTAAELQAYFQAFIPVVAASLVLSVVIGPFLSATGYRLGSQYVAGDPPSPFGPSLGSLAWRFLLLGLTLLALYLAAALLVVAFVAVAQAILGLGLTVLIVVTVVVVGSLWLAIRLALAPAMLLSGAGPVGALRLSWELTRGHFGIAFRWIFVTGLLMAVIGALIGGALGLIFAAIGLPVLGQLVSGLITGPFLVIQAIIQILLARLLSGPIEPPPPAPVPEWMSGSATGG